MDIMCYAGKRRGVDSKAVLESSSVQKLKKRLSKHIAEWNLNTIYKLLSTDIEKQKMNEHLLLELNHTRIKNKMTRTRFSLKIDHPRNYPESVIEVLNLSSLENSEKSVQIFSFDLMICEVQYFFINLFIFTFVLNINVDETAFKTSETIFIFGNYYLTSENVCAQSLVLPKVFPSIKVDLDVSITIPQHMKRSRRLQGLDLYAIYIYMFFLRLLIIDFVSNVHESLHDETDDAQLIKKIKHNGVFKTLLDLKKLL
ncbi:hypothetical protein AGLY_009678 [Aphis glycines]|uniref:Uncharacterized protein n=1 Tax=Aphis glycines TaxID=307491 RepID=A0A6G0TGI7_APHGL|nr:hypothetical protein AGLY_009678 [Aphis glycines]